ncbi:MAG: hypothetical protein FWH29_06375 [Methanobrevibacter sp.]|nr:hypothetical protein [Methanobrevibacter sp.]
MENEIRNFATIERFEKYDKIKNHLQLSVNDLLAIGVEWEYNGQKFKLQKGKKIEAVLLKNNKNIAIIEEPFNKIKNKAYIISGNNEVKFNIKELLEKNRSKVLEYNLKEFNFYDAYYINKELYFFVNINGLDYRFSFDIETGECGELISSK